MALSKWEKIGLYCLPVLAGGIGVWLYLKYYYIVPAKTAVANTNGILPKSNPSSVSSASSSNSNSTSGCTFPLVNGSNNPCVGQLQDVLGVTIDNNFGNITQAALLAQVGLTQVTSAAQLSSIEDTILNQDGVNLTPNLAASNSLISQYGTSSPTYIVTTAATTWNQVTEDSNNNWNFVGYQISLNAGKKISVADYTLYTSDSTNGMLIITCNKGVNQGYWRADPTVLTLS